VCVGDVNPGRHDPRERDRLPWASGGVAALDPRLLSGTPPASGSWPSEGWRQKTEFRRQKAGGGNLGGAAATALPGAGKVQSSKSKVQSRRSEPRGIGDFRFQDLRGGGGNYELWKMNYEETFVDMVILLCETGRVGRPGPKGRDDRADGFMPCAAL
jgi:hypothetical protein